MSTFIEETGDWIKYRLLKPQLEVDFHCALSREIPYEEAMADIHKKALLALIDAQKQNIPYVLFTHGHSTSRIGKVTARSVIRSLMRSKEATPYILRKKCIQHYSVFLAVIKILRLNKS